MVLKLVRGNTKKKKEKKGIIKEKKEETLKSMKIYTFNCFKMSVLLKRPQSEKDFEVGGKQYKCIEVLFPLLSKRSHN